MKPEDFIPALQNGRTELLTGFRSRKGNAFDSYLVFDAETKKFSFAFQTKAPASSAITLKLTKPKGKRKR
jgi:hypothetical protein